MTIPACTGPCEQGRLPCKTPEACQLPEDDEATGMLKDFAWAGCAVIASFILAYVLSAMV